MPCDPTSISMIKPLNWTLTVRDFPARAFERGLLCLLYIAMFSRCTHTRLLPGLVRKPTLEPFCHADSPAQGWPKTTLHACYLPFPAPHLSEVDATNTKRHACTEQLQMHMQTTMTTTFHHLISCYSIPRCTLFVDMCHVFISYRVTWPLHMSLLHCYMHVCSSYSCLTNIKPCFADGKL